MGQEHRAGSSHRGAAKKGGSLADTWGPPSSHSLPGCSTVPTAHKNHQERLQSHGGAGQGKGLTTSCASQGPGLPGVGKGAYGAQQVRPAGCAAPGALPDRLSWRTQTQDAFQDLCTPTFTAELSVMLQTLEQAKHPKTAGGCGPHSAQLSETGKSPHCVCLTLFFFPLQHSPLFF